MAIVLAALVALASTSAIHPLDHCAHAETTEDLNRCGQLYLAESEANLKRSYQEALGSLSNDDKKRLVTAQRAWIAFREKICEFEMHHVGQGGSISDQIWLGCMSGLADDRAAELDKITAWQD
jgi:uncharacterized protein YecT (DUF1311 family)